MASWERGSQFNFDDGDNLAIPTLGAYSQYPGYQSPYQTWDPYDGFGVIATGNAVVYKYGPDTGAYGSLHARPRNVALLACMKL